MVTLLDHEEDLHIAAWSPVRALVDDDVGPRPKHCRHWWSG